MSEASLPDGWHETTLGNISKNVMYGMNAKAVPYDGKHKYIRITDIDEGTNKFIPNPLTSPDGKIGKQYKLRDGDIVFARTGASVGKSYLYNKQDGELYFAGFLIKFCIIKDNPQFIFAQTQECDYWNWVQSVSMRSGQPGINAEEFKKLPIIIAPLPEQKAIANILQTWDTAIEKTEALIAAKERQFDWLSRKLIIDNEQMQINSHGWKKVKLGNIGDIITGNTPPKRESNNYGGTYCWATAEDFKNGYITDTKIKLTKKGKKLARFVPAGSVLVTCIGSIGLNAIAKISLSTNQQINSIVPYSEYDSDFIYYLIQNGKNKLESFAGSGGVLMLNKNEFSKIEFFFPPLAEQKRIAYALNTAQQEIDTLRKLAEQYHTQKRGLMQKLLTGKWRIKV